MLGNTTDAHGAELVILGVDHVCRAQSLVARLLPLRDKRRIDKLVADAILVNLIKNAVGETGNFKILQR